MEAEVGEWLETVEKNPGPRRRGGGKLRLENMRVRRERRYSRRRERRAGRGKALGLAVGGGGRIGDG